jgi:hypothetical protein
MAGAHPAVSVVSGGGGSGAAYRKIADSTGLVERLRGNRRNSSRARPPCADGR